MSRNIARKNDVVGPFHVTGAVTGTMNREKRINREKRLALNFVFLSACFLFQTIVYNLPFRQVYWYKYLIKFSFNLNLSKWAIYTLENAKIREGFIALCRRRQLESSTTSVVTITPAR
ncbi:hypothetical protein V3C99_016158 [Haemonchus contortus]